MAEGVKSGAAALLSRYCVRCHGPDEEEAGIRFDRLDALEAAARREVLAQAREQLALGEMPPEDEAQPTKVERARLEAWFAREFESEGRNDKARRELEDKLRLPAYGNLIAHDELFGGAGHGPAWTPARRWLVRPQIFHERVMDVFRLDGRWRQNMLRRSFAGVTNPFVLNDASGVRDYDVGSLDGGDLLVMLGNAAWIADRQILVARALNKEKIEFPSRRDRWMPRPLPKSYEAFSALLRFEGTSETRRAEAGGAGGNGLRERMLAAIDEQFDCVLRRAPREDERVRYLELMRSAMRADGLRAALRQMLVAVLLESDFVYRLEFGAGDADEHGRRMLAPAEMAAAISYALGDRRPDEALREAAASGRLATRADVAREVKRLLADGEYYKGPIDASLDGKHYRSNVTSHPRIVRFFREFFGYPGATKVFKDPPRSGGVYRNPGRGTSATPGRLILETDRIVTRIVEADSDVFETLLTSDEFFVYHDRANEAGRKIIEEWRAVWERLKGTAWRTEPETVLAEHLGFLKGMPSLRMRDAKRPGELVNLMHYFEESFGQGTTPFTTVPWAHGYTFHHAPLYNLPPTPSIGRYGSWKSTKYRGGKIKAKHFWDYPTAQPFRIAHRKGILTHPSWLIAHSTNFHGDPVRRGRWIREKLLAGRVPDVPITVDAQVPEHPDKTFRQRLEEVTSKAECVRCHERMNPLGNPFEAFHDFGRYREREVLEHPDNLLARGNGKTSFDRYKTAPVKTSGRLDGTGEAKLDGPVDDPFELIDRLARARRVRQSILRYAFRFFLGRNERLRDAKTLVDAEHAYLERGGSFRAVVLSLLSSDSFLYRKSDA